MSNLKAAKATKSESRVTSVTKRTKDDKEIRISVEEIENGFLITKNTEWHDKKNGYQWKTEKFFSSENPLDFDPEKSLADSFNSSKK